MKRNQRKKDIAKAIKLSWDSLESHLPYVYENGKDKRFHVGCVKDYAFIIQVLSDEL